MHRSPNGAQHSTRHESHAHTYIHLTLHRPHSVHHYHCLACMSYLVCTTKQLQHSSPHHHHTGGITSTFTHVASIASKSCQLAINGRATLLSGHQLLLVLSVLLFHLTWFLIGLGAMMKNSGTLVCVVNVLRFSSGCSFHLGQVTA